MDDNQSCSYLDQHGPYFVTPAPPGAEKEAVF